MPRGTIKYWTGYLAADRLKRPGLGDMADKMMRLYERGEVYLVQRKVAEYVYDYLAVPTRGRYDDYYAF